jgi:ribosomal protein L40E
MQSQASAQREIRPGRQTMAMVCLQCGSDNRGVARFCRRCGAPLPLRRAVAIVGARCSSTARPYSLIFEQSGDGPWVLRRTEMSAPSQNSDGEQLRLSEVAWHRTEISPCPYCANDALIQCGSCNGLSCHPSAEKGATVKCACCGTGFVIEGHIRQLDGKKRL